MRQLRIDLGKCDSGRNCQHECETACATKVFKLEDPAMAALHIQDGGAVLCDQCGDCMVVCPADALTRNKLGAVLVHKELCVGCYMCLGFCEKGAFQRHAGWLEPYKCTSCGICVKACPHGALTIVDVPVPAPRII